MNLFEIIKNAPETSQLITDSIVITHSKLQQYNNYSFAGKASEKRSAFEKSVGDYFEPDIEKSRYTNNGIPLIIQELINNLILKVLEKRNRSDSSRNVQYIYS